jgi:ABC-2 type transport system ATP-binding protein
VEVISRPTVFIDVGASDDRQAVWSGTGSVLVALEGVRKSWGDHVVLDGVDLEIPAGAVIGVAGGNGAGKTTLLRIATGIILPDEGTTRFRRVDIEQDRASYRKEIGFLSAGDRGLYARLTVRQNLDFWGGLAGLPRRQRRRRIGDVLSEFEIVEFADRRVDRLSMGQRQRVRLAMTFLHEPTIVFLDEPKTSLDEAGVSLLNAAVARLVDQGGAVLWISPEIEESIVAQSWVLRKGELEAFISGASGLASAEVPSGIS